MMKRGLQFIILIALLISLSNCRKSEVDIVYDKKYLKEIKSIRKELSFYFSRNYIPGGSFAILKDGKIIYSEGIGMASNDLEVPVTRNTKFRIGKVSEVFTSLMFQMMVEDGTLNPDSSFHHYLPDFPEKEYKVSLLQLANHTSGIREPSIEENEWRGLNVSLEKALERFKDDALSSPPDWFQQQSMYNYNLLGAIMEKATKRRYPDLLKDYITDTLQLNATEIDHPFKTILGRTNFFDHNLVAQVVPATFRDMRYRAPSEGILSNAEDLVKFGNAILNSELISANIKKRLFELPVLEGDIPASMANGWMVFNSKDGKPAYGRTGAVTGGGAAILIYPDKNLVIAGTINLTSDIDDIPVFQMAAPFFDEEINPE